MKKYVSHKQVEAAPIQRVQLQCGCGAKVRLEGGVELAITEELASRLAAAVCDSPNRSFLDFYLVRYSDGYLSFSPAKAFEEGYTELGEAHDKAYTEAAAVVDFIPVYPPLPQWEYVSGYDLTTEQLLRLGKDGWEAYAVSDSPLGLRYHFKRPLRSAP